MKTSSAKSKGRLLQNKVRDDLLKSYPELEPDDCKCAIMGCSGQDILLSPAAKKIIPYAIECKNQESINIWSSLEQAEKNKKDLEPLLVFKRNRTKTYVVMEWEHFLKIIKPSAF